MEGGGKTIGEFIRAPGTAATGVNNFFAGGGKVTDFLNNFNPANDLKRGILRGVAAGIINDRKTQETSFDDRIKKVGPDEEMYKRRLEAWKGMYATLKGMTERRSLTPGLAMALTASPQNTFFQEAQYSRDIGADKRAIDTIATQVHTDAEIVESNKAKIKAIEDERAKWRKDVEEADKYKLTEAYREDFRRNASASVSFPNSGRIGPVGGFRI
jgi:hypothetical protein